MASYSRRYSFLSEYAHMLKAKRGGSAKRFADAKKKAQERARELLQGADREKVVALAMLYWGEGHKKSCEFINSDGSMIRIYLGILRNVFEVPEHAIKPTMRIFTGMDRVECLSYWSRITGIPKDNFTVRFNDGGTRGRTKYGLCRITVRKGSQNLKIILAIIDQYKEEI